MQIDPILIFLSDETYKFIQGESERLGRSMRDLAECAVEDYCNGITKNFNRTRPK